MEKKVLLLITNSCLIIISISYKIIRKPSVNIIQINYKASSFPNSQLLEHYQKRSLTDLYTMMYY